MGFASVIGTSHVKTNTECQDASDCTVITAADGGTVLLAVAADGAGTAACSRTGAKLAVAQFLAKFGKAAETDSTLAQIDRGFVDGWIADWQAEIATHAQRESARPDDYACTLLGAVIGPAGAAYVQIGDGAIVVGTEELGEYTWIVWPQHGEYANTTCFLSQPDAAAVMVFETGPAVDEIAIFTDGIERLMLDMTARVVHAPAFRPIFDWLATTQPDQTAQSSAHLATYLGSAPINQRTDDDKTLIMATRAEPAAPPVHDGERR